MHDVVPALLAELLRASHFEEAAHALLRCLLERCASALRASAPAIDEQILRGLVHVRPSDDYLALASLRYDGPSSERSSERSRKAAVPSELASATAWRWIEEQDCPITVDVLAGRITAISGGNVRELRRGGDAFDSKKSQVAAVARDTTHMFVLPLRPPGQTTIGMVSVEARCPAAIGGDFIWPALGPDLELLATVAAPYLANLPARRADGPTASEHLPVVGASMARSVSMLGIFAKQNETILLGGPTGAGKSRLARWIHERSLRRKAPFERLDLATIPEDLQLGHLFGWKKGAFTSAQDHRGAVARAKGGTLFIDEVDKLSLRAQAGLLQLLEERIYRPLGDNAPEQDADVRFVIGTNIDIRAAVRKGNFREDLFYRINVLPLRVPPLSERVDEIPAWVAYMAERRHKEGQREGSSATSVVVERAAEERLCAAPWPGNLRQLDNIVRRAYALATQDHLEDSAEIVIREAHVKDAFLAGAFDLDPEAGASSALDLLYRAGQAMVREAEAHRAERVVKLDSLEGLKGLVLSIAAQKYNSVEEAFKLFGREATVASRNHHKAYRVERNRLVELYRAFGEEARLPADPFVDGQGD